MTMFLNVLIGGLIMGGIYALISMGLSTQYGVARILNVSHGEFIMVGAFITWQLNTSFALNPIIALAVAGPISFVICFVIHRTLFKRVKDISTDEAFEGNAILIAFGLMFIVQNLATIRWGTQLKGISFMTYPVNIGEAVFPANRLMVLLLAVIICVAYYLFLTHTRLGKSIRAAAQDPVAASMLGIKINRVMAICFGIGGLLAAFSGVLICMILSLTTTMGMSYTVIAIIVVVLGGLGSIPGAILGGFILGFVGTAVNYQDPSLTIVFFYVIILALLIVRPKGLLGR